MLDTILGNTGGKYAVFSQKMIAPTKENRGEKSLKWQEC